MTNFQSIEIIKFLIQKTDFEKINFKNSYEIPFYISLYYNQKFEVIKLLIKKTNFNKLNFIYHNDIPLNSVLNHCKSFEIIKLLIFKIYNNKKKIFQKFLEIYFFLLL